MSHIVYSTSRAMAWLGACVLVFLAVLSVVSIGGRALSGLGLGPVPGDFELVEAGTALAVFCFLPWAHLRRSHAAVDMLWQAYPASLKRVLAVMADALMLLVWMLLVWRMALATLDYRANAEVSFILQMPVWWGYAASMVPAALGCVAYAWRLLETLDLVQAPDEFRTEAMVH
ncbi:MAG: TRAP transporter small permease subunit [Rubrivivax sp.]|nr:TRAP transporter small permease subunit [Rubrivivax sp.]